MGLKWFDYVGHAAVGAMDKDAEIRKEQLDRRFKELDENKTMYRALATTRYTKDLEKFEEETKKWFSTIQTSPLMSFAAHLRSTIPTTKFPGITHVDRSSRIQTIAPHENPILYQLLDRFRKETDCPMLVNTSFNVRGEPIVCSPDDAYQCFMKTNLDALAIGNFYLRKQDQPVFNTEANSNKQKNTWRNRISNVWQSLTFPVRWIVSKTALLLVYYLCILPISLLAYRSRTKIKSSPVSQTDKKTISYWRPRNTPLKNNSYFRQY